jgi:hypothetical protein
MTVGAENRSSRTGDYLVVGITESGSAIMAIGSDEPRPGRRNIGVLRRSLRLSDRVLIGTTATWLPATAELEEASDPHRRERALEVTIRRARPDSSRVRDANTDVAFYGWVNPTRPEAEFEGGLVLVSALGAIASERRSSSNNGNTAFLGDRESMEIHPIGLEGTPEAIADQLFAMRGGGSLAVAMWDQQGTLIQQELTALQSIPMAA